MYLIVSKKEWHYKNFESLNSKNFFLIKDKKSLTLSKLKKINPKIIFFPHWSWKIPDNITKNFTCICFHETKLPYGRGGSPIQNLIKRNKKKTIISAFKMNKILDGGDIVLTQKLSLNGSAQDIFEKSSKKIFQMIKKISKMKKMKLRPQSGKVVKFKRLKNNSFLNYRVKNLNQLYNHIRMMDADTYKKVYFTLKNLKFELYDAKKTKRFISAKVKIDLI